VNLYLFYQVYLFIRSSSSGIIVVQCSPASTSQVVGAAVGAVGTVGVGRGIDAAGVGRTVRRGVESTGVGVGRGSHQGGGRTVGGQELRLATGNGQQGEQAHSELVGKLGKRGI